MKRIAWRVYNFFRGPVGFTGQAGEPGAVPVEWEQRLRRVEESLAKQRSDD